jgi:hypothetical protein
VLFPPQQINYDLEKNPCNILQYIMVFGGLRRAMGYTEESAQGHGI